MKPVGITWRHARAKLDLSVEEAATALGIAAGTLRNIESGQPRANVSLRLAYRAQDLYGLPLDELASTSEGRPDEPPKTPKREPKAPARRQDSEKRPGPKRNVAADELRAVS